MEHKSDDANVSMHEDEVVLKELPRSRLNVILCLEAVGSALRASSVSEPEVLGDYDFVPFRESLPGVYSDLNPQVSLPLGDRFTPLDRVQVVQARSLKDLSAADRKLPVRLICYKGPVTFRMDGKPVLCLPDKMGLSAGDMTPRSMTAFDLGQYKPHSATVLWLTLTHECDPEAQEQLLEELKVYFREVIVTYTEEHEMHRGQFLKARQWLMQLWGRLFVPELGDHDMTARAQLQLYLKEHTEDGFAQGLQQAKQFEEPRLKIYDLKGVLYQGHLAIHTSRLRWHPLNTLMHEDHYWENSTSLSQERLFISSGVWHMCRRAASRVVYSLNTRTFSHFPLMGLWLSADSLTVVELMMRLVAVLFPDYERFARYDLASGAPWPERATRVVIACDLSVEEYARDLKATVQSLSRQATLQRQLYQSVYLVFYGVPRYPALDQLLRLKQPVPPILSFSITLDTADKCRSGGPLLRAQYADSVMRPTLAKAFPGAGDMSLSNLGWAHDHDTVWTDAIRIIDEKSPETRYVMFHSSKGAGRAVKLLCIPPDRKSTMEWISVDWTPYDERHSYSQTPTFSLKFGATKDLLRSGNLASLLWRYHGLRFGKDEGWVLLPSCSEWVPLSLLHLFHTGKIEIFKADPDHDGDVTWYLDLPEEQRQQITPQLRLFVNHWTDKPVDYALLHVWLTDPDPSQRCHAFSFPVSLRQDMWLQPVSLVPSESPSPKVDAFWKHLISSQAEVKSPVGLERVPWTQVVDRQEELAAAEEIE